jgi:hypothetical protein
MDPLNNCPTPAVEPLGRLGRVLTTNHCTWIQGCGSYQRRHLTEGQVGSNRLLGALFFYFPLHEPSPPIPGGQDYNPLPFPANILNILVCCLFVRKSEYLPLSKEPPLACDGYIYSESAPNGWRFSGLAGCAGLGSLYLYLHRSTHHRRHQAEGQIRC